MSVEFNDESNQIPFSNSPRNNQSSGLVNLILKTGIIKDQTQANYILIGISIIAFLLSFYFWGGLTPSNTAPKITSSIDPKEIINTLQVR